MSWDIDLHTPTAHVADFNYTHNTNPAIRYAGVQWDAESLEGITARELGERIKPFLDLCVAQPEEFDRYDPDNGWGHVLPNSSLDGASVFEVLLKMRKACRQYPEAIVIASF